MESGEGFQKMKRVSVLIPSHNRPQLLREAIESLANQTYPEWEVVLIDDGSTTPIDVTDLRALAGREIILLRNDSPLGQATSRERGEKVATGEFIFHLDDDDLLAANVLESGVSVLSTAPEIDIVFFNVKGFGERADSFDRAQRDALEKVLRLAEGIESERGLIRFEKSIFPALLRTIPMAFQRPMAKREVWREVTGLRRKAYGPDHPLPPPLRESEWALYAMAAKRVALVTSPLYLQRCNGQGFFSIESKREAAERAALDVFEHLLWFSKTEPAFLGWQQEIKKAMARCYFDQAYAGFHRGSRIAPAKYLLKALALDPNVAYFRHGLRMLLPRRD